MLTVERLKSLLSYNPDTGLFVWRVKRRGPAAAGMVAGTPHSNGYVSIKIDGRRYFAHRLAWLYMNGCWPPEQIDHIDLDKTNNVFSNLRAATPRQNSVNTPARRSQSGLKGTIFWRGKYAARIKVGSRTIHLGTFATPEEAHAAYAVAAKMHFGEYARTA